jgi:probable F420-dependent oxidoreductase
MRAMKVDGSILTRLDDVPARSRELEAAGYDGIWSAETSHDPFFPLVLAAEHTERVDLGTSIAVAFARGPMTLANIGYDLQLQSKGRMNLGLGSQIKAHITKRFSMPFTHPAARMREMVTAIRAIWDSWETGDKLDFRGDFYTHTLMTPFFNPGPNPYGTAKISISAVGPLMTEVAGECCDGILIHGFTTERYLKEVTLPHLEAGARKAGRDVDDIEVISPAFIATGRTEEAFEAAKRARREQVSFYGSTPAYRDVLDLHGWGDLQEELNTLSKAGRWADMVDVIDDEVLEAFVIVAEPDQVAAEVQRRMGDAVDRVFLVEAHSDLATWQPVLEGLRAVGV